jgi:phosphatidate cytidylyltransferase
MSRVLTAALLLPVAVYLIVASPRPVLAVAVTALGCLCYQEFRRLAEAHAAPAPVVGMVAGAALLLAPARNWELMTAVMFAGFAWSIRTSDLRQVLPGSSALALGTLYCFGPWLAALRLRDVSVYWLLLAVSLSWVGDAAAFATGKLAGRRQLAPRISPGKTWEGALGSLIASSLFGIAFSRILLPHTGTIESVFVTAGANIAGQLGDLWESALKRGADVKDSGAMLPGHGGWLDRLDSTLFAVVAVYVWVSGFGLRVRAFG